MKRFGVMYGNKGRRKMVLSFASAFEATSSAKAFSDMGFRVRKFTRKPAKGKGGWK